MSTEFERWLERRKRRKTYQAAPRLTREEMTKAADVAVRALRRCYDDFYEWFYRYSTKMPHEARLEGQEILRLTGNSVATLERLVSEWKRTLKI